MKQKKYQKYAKKNAKKEPTFKKLIEIYKKYLKRKKNWRSFGTKIKVHQMQQKSSKNTEQNTNSRKSASNLTSEFYKSTDL